MSNTSGQNQIPSGEKNNVLPYTDPYHRPDQPEPRPLGLSANGPALATKAQSVRHFRKTICLAIIAFTIGSLAIVLNSPLRSDFLAPGPLTNSHAQILGGLKSERCQACHEAGEQTVSQWLAGTLTGERAPGNPHCQSELCLKCHQESLKSGFPMSPHGMPTNDLAMITQRALSKTADGKTIQVSAIQTGQATEVSCSVCHREHHGQQFNLSAMTDQQCQVCHTSTFHRFDLDHPNFAVAANSEHAAVNFDHFTHGTRHFSGANRTFDCKACHTADSTGRNQITASYEQACATCHNPALVDSQSRGIELVSLPILDLEALRAAGLDLNHWPKTAAGDFDGRMPPITRLLLSADPDLQPTVNKLPDSFQFSDIDPRRNEDLQLAGKLAIGYERLFLEISQSGKSAIIERLNRVTQPDSAKSGSTLESVFLDLEDAVLRDAVRTWMPGIVSGELPQDPDGSIQTEINVLKRGLSPLMRRKPQDGELLAENPVARLLRSNDDAVKSTQSGPADPLVANSQAASTGVVLQQASPDQQSSSGPGRSDTKQQAANKTPTANFAGELLSANPLHSYGIRNPANAEQAQAEPKLSSDTELSENLAESRSFGNASPKQAANRSDQLPADSSFFPSSIPQSRPGSNRWKRDDNLMVISWQPSGHSDTATRLIHEWIASARSVSSPNAGLDHFVKAFKSGTSPGQCSLCHRTKLSGATGNAFAWQSPSPVNRPKGFTKFDHGPHTMIANCESCHSLSDIDSTQKAGAPFQLASWKQADQTSNGSAGDNCGLNPVTARDCAACHRPNAAPTGCTTCHNYHVANNSPQNFETTALSNLRSRVVEVAKHPGMEGSLARSTTSIPKNQTESCSAQPAGTSDK